MGICGIVCDCQRPLLQMVVNRTTKLSAPQLGTVWGLLISNIHTRGYRLNYKRFFGQIDSQIEIHFTKGGETQVLRKFETAEEATQEAIDQIVAKIETLSSDSKI